MRIAEQTFGRTETQEGSKSSTLSDCSSDQAVESARPYLEVDALVEVVVEEAVAGPEVKKALRLYPGRRGNTGGSATLLVEEVALSNAQNHTAAEWGDVPHSKGAPFALGLPGDRVHLKAGAEKSYIKLHGICLSRLLLFFNFVILNLLADSFSWTVCNFSEKRFL
jgi:hypothetical protein